MTLSSIDKLKAQRDKLNARIQAVEARTKTAERKNETRRKILVGAYYLEEAEKNKTLEDLKNKMDKFLIRNSDRALFNLPMIEEK